MVSLAIVDNRGKILGYVIKDYEKKWIFYPNIDTVDRDDIETFWEIFYKKKPSAFRSKLIAKYTDEMLSPEFKTPEDVLKWVENYKYDIESAIRETYRKMARR